MKIESTATPEILAAALERVAGSMKAPLQTVADGLALAEKSILESIQRVAADQAGIQEKIRNGSRLTQHRFTSRLPLR